MSESCESVCIRHRRGKDPTLGGYKSCIRYEQCVDSPSRSFSCVVDSMYLLYGLSKGLTYLDSHAGCFLKKKGMK